MNNNQSNNYSNLDSISAIWPIMTSQFGEVIAVNDPHSKPSVSLTYNQLYEQIKQFAIALQILGVKTDSKVALFADNSPRWLICDQGIIISGAANVVRSSQAEKQELLYILEDSDSNYLVVENIKTLQKLQPELDNLPIEKIILLSDETRDDNSEKIINFQQFLSTSENYSLQSTQQNRDNLATLIYTSGTTGKPKGVMLSHGNLLHQIINIDVILQPKPGEKALSILPTWHSYERSCEYFLLSRGCTIIYTNLRSIKQDLKQFQPHYMVGVPRLWESIYEGVQKQFREQSASQQKLISAFLNISENYILARRIANNLSLNHLHASSFERFLAAIKAAILKPLHSLADKIVYQKIRQVTGGHIKILVSGGGSLATHLDNFFEIVGIPVLVGYGLTETSPVTNARTLERNLIGSAGQPLPETEIKIVDLDTRQALPTETKGLVLIRGAQVMQGYYKKPEATAKVIDSDGWFDSGDIGWITAENDLILTGRAKDTIVLTNGENIEPQPIEDACQRSPYIDQIMLVGQDQRFLGALIVPNLEALEKWATAQNITLKLPAIGDNLDGIENSDLNIQKVRDLYRTELTREVKNRPGYRMDDRIGDFAFILKPFSMENNMMTQTFKIKRPVVTAHYQDIIDKIFNK